VAMLTAALRDERNVQFVFLSQDTVPLKTFSYVHRNLVDRSRDKSKFCFAEPARHESAIVEQITNELQQRCIFRDFYSALQPRVMKHHQWIVLSRQHATIIAREARNGMDVWADTWRQAAPDLTTMGEGCSDESVPVTTLLREAAKSNATTGNAIDDLEAMGVERNCLTFVHWYNCFQHTDFHMKGWGTLTSLHYRGEDLFRYAFDNDFDFVHETKMNGFPTKYNTVKLSYLEAMAAEGFMFARKFPRGSNVSTQSANVSLSALLPEVWGRINETKAEQSRWTHLGGPDV